MKTQIEELEQRLLSIGEEIKQLKTKAVEPKFEVGKWYKKGSNFLVFTTRKVSEIYSHFDGYGFDITGNWVNKPWTDSFGLEGCVPATESEIKEALIKEAVRRGFKEGVKYITAGRSTNSIVNNYFEYWTKDDCLISGNNTGTIYWNGQWATILKNEPIKIGTHEVEFIKGYVKVGCKRFTNEFVISLREEMVSNDSKAFQLGFNSGWELISLETLTKIIERIK